MLEQTEKLVVIEAYVNRFTPIPRPYIAELVSQSRLRSFNKNELFLNEGDICCELLFIHRGAFRYFLTKEGDDFTKDFSLDSTNPFCTGYSSFITQTPSVICIESLEDSLVSVWSERYIKESFSSLPWLAFARKIAEMLYVRKEKREISLLRDSASERYQNFTQEFKDVMQRVPQYHIASYLGITPESLSRIRRAAPERS